MIRFLKKLIFNDYIACSIFVGVLIGLISLIPVNHALVEPYVEALSDFDAKDLAFTALKPETDADTNIVLVNISTMEKGELALLVGKISQYSPAVIGINKILKNTETSEDTLLANVLSQTPNVVLAAQTLSFTNGETNWQNVNYPDSIFTHFILDSLTVRYANVGFKNLPNTDRDFKTTRTFMPTLTIDKEKHEAFSLKLAEYLNQGSVDYALNRNNKQEIINYKGNFDQFFALEGYDVLEGNFEPSVLTGKIVLLGYLGEAIYNNKFWDKDKLYTPTNKKYAGKTFPDMYETVILANVTSMILEKNYKNIVNPSIELLINLLIIFINVILFSMLFHAAAVWWDAFSIVITLVESILLLFATTIIFTFFSYSISLNLSLVFLLVLGNFLELYYGIFKIALQKLNIKYMINLEFDKKTKVEKVLKKEMKDLMSDLLKGNTKGDHIA